MSYPAALAALSKSSPVYEIIIYCTDVGCSCPKRGGEGHGCSDSMEGHDLSKHMAYGQFVKDGWTHTDNRGWKCPCCPPMQPELPLEGS